MVTDRATRLKIKCGAASLACGAVFALSHIPAAAAWLARLDDGRGLDVVLTAPGLTAVAPSWVIRYVFLLAALWGLAPLLASAGRVLMELVRRGRAELGDAVIVGVLAVAAGAAAAAFGYAALGAEGHVWDEREYDFQARIFASGRLTATAPETDEAVTLAGGGARNFLVGWNEAVNNRRWFTIYLPVWPLVLAAGEALGRPWLVNPAIGVITTFVFYGMGRRLLGADAGLAAAALFAFSPFALFNNASFFSEPIFLLLLLLTIWSFVVARERGSRTASFAAGFLFAAAFGAREYATVTAAVPLFIIAFRDKRTRRTARVNVFVAALGLLAGMAPLFLYNYLTSANVFRFPRFYAVKTHFGLSLPFISSDMIFFTTRRLWVLATDVGGWPLVSILPALAPLFLKKTPAPVKLLYAVAAATVLLFILPHHKGINYGARYYYGVLPAAFLVGGYGLTLLSDAFRNNRSLPHGTVPAAAALAFAIATPAYVAAVTPIYRDYWGFPEGKKPWVTSQLEQAMAEYGIWQGIVFIGPPERCEGPAPNDVALKNNLIFARDRGARNAEFAARWLGNAYLSCDYREFEKTGVLHVLDLKTPPAAPAPQ